MKFMKPVEKHQKIHESADDKVFDIAVFMILTLAFLSVLYPLIYIFSSSFSATNAVVSGKVILWPVEPTLNAYIKVFNNASIMRGYRNSLFYTVTGTAICLVLCVLTSYALSRKNFYGRKIFASLIIFTMFFSGGLIPTFLLVRNLGMTNTIWSLIIPGGLNAWYIILIRTYFEGSIPEELYESASIDGCGIVRMIPTIVIPLSGPIIAVITLYSAVAIWSSYFDAFIYISDRNLFPLQIILRNILLLNKFDESMLQDTKQLEARQGLINVLKYACIVAATVPPMIIYPFVQKYFIRGIMVGSVKG